MKKKLKVGFIAFHPGATNTLTKVLKQLRQDGHEVFCYPFLEYAKKEWDLDDDTLFVDSMDFFNHIPTDFDAIMYSSAADSLVENHLPIFCKKHGIVCISTIDVFWLSEKELIRRFNTLPDILITPEQSVMNMIQDLEWEVDVYNYGNPHLEIEATADDTMDRANKIINYISFPNGNDILCDTADLSKQILTELLDIMKEESSIKQLYLSLHPRENHHFVEELLNQHAELTHRVTINPFENTTECCKRSNIIVGYSSTVLYEELLKGKSVVFYENKDQLKSALLTDQHVKKEIDFEIPKNSVENIIHLLYSLKK